MDLPNVFLVQLPNFSLSFSLLFQWLQLLLVWLYIKVTRLILLQKKKKKKQYYSSRHWLIIWELRLIWSREVLLREILYLSFGFWGQFSGAKWQSHFPSSWRNSWILNIIHMQLVPNTTVEQALRPQTFRTFWPFSSSHYKYISRTYASCSFTPLTWPDAPSRCGHKTLYVNCPQTLYVVGTRSKETWRAHSHCWSGT